MACKKPAKFVYLEHTPVASGDSTFIECKVFYLCRWHKDIVAAILPDARIERDDRGTVPCGALDE